MNSMLQSRIARIQLIALVVGFVGLGVTAIGWFTNPRQFFFSYLYSFVFWLGLSLGCFVVTLIHQLTGGRWGYPTRRFLEAGFMSLPLMVVLFIPIFFGLRELYPWARPLEVAAQPVLQARHAYMNQAAYIVRQFGFLGVWIGMAMLLRKWSIAQDATTDAGPTRKARTLSGPGLVVFGLVGTFASLDWIMSLERHWYSSMFAIIIIIGQILSAYAFAVIMLAFFRKQEPFAKVLTQTHYHQLGNLLLTFVLFWTYVSFGQLLIVYSGDLPHELEWYLHRIAGSWKTVVAALALFHFFLPFFLLLFRLAKQTVSALTVLAAMLFVMHIVAVYWLVMPALHHDGMAVSWLDFTALIGIGGVWLSVFLSRLKAAALLPQNDPGMQFAFVYAR
ncbi:MAG: hypothetical protein ACTHLW_10705 [Verrucomicrobiota bacterium]